MDEHAAVLVDEVHAALALRAGGYYVDATFGRGGHTARILETLGGEGRVLALDRDPGGHRGGPPALRRRTAPYARARAVFAACGYLCRHIRRDAHAPACSSTLAYRPRSSTTPERGFSFRADGPLDMRMDPTRGEPVCCMARPGGRRRDARGDRHPRRGALRAPHRAGHRERARAAPITRTAQLAELVARAVRTREPGKNPATRTFQALRMFINDELGQLRRAWPRPSRCSLLADGWPSSASTRWRIARSSSSWRATPESDPALARLPVIPASAQPRMQLIGRKQRPAEAEIGRNPRARSALLRVAEKLS